MTQEGFYTHDYISDPLNATVVPSEEDSLEPLINSKIAITGEDGVVVRLVVLEKKHGPGDDENHYIVRHHDSDHDLLGMKSQMKTLRRHKILMHGQSLVFTGQVVPLAVGLGDAFL